MKKATVGLVLALILAMVPSSSISSASSESKDVVVLTSSNTIVLNSEVNGDSVSKVISEAKKLDNAQKSFKDKLTGSTPGPIYLFLNTPGGSIQAGLELIEALNGLDRKVSTITLFAASMGWQIAQNMGERLILKNGVLMSHHAAGEFVGSFGGVTPSQLDSRYQLWLDRIKELDETTVARTKGKQTYDSYTKQYDHEMWLTGTKSVDQGYADRIVTVKCDASLSGTTEHTAQVFGFNITYELDNCPINTSPQNIKIAMESPLNEEFQAHIKKQFLAQFLLAQKKAIPMY